MGRESLHVLFFVLVSTLVSGYYYGLVDHAIVIPYMRSYYNPSLYPGDFLVAQAGYYYTFLWIILGFFTEVLGVPSTLVFFGVYLLSKFLVFYAVYLIAELLFKRRVVSYLALFFLIVNKASLGGDDMFDAILINRVPVLPFLFFAIYFYLKDRKKLAYILMGLGFNIHGLSVLAVFTGLSLACLATTKDLRRFGTYVFFFLLFASPLLAWKVIATPPSLNLFHADPHWIELLRSRTSHYFPSMWDAGEYTVAAAFLVFFILSSLRQTPDASHHRSVVYFISALVFTTIIGFVFIELYPVPAAFNVQMHRGFKFIQYLTVIYFSSHLVRTLEDSRRRLIETIVWLLAAVALFFGRKIGYPIHYASLAALLALAGAIAYTKASGGKIRVTEKHVFYATTLVAAGFIVVNGLSSFTIANTQPQEWLNIQYWAKDSTSKADMFLTPPLNDGFRVESQRPIYGDWKDGILMQLNPAFGFEWEKRMNNVGCFPDRWWECNDNYNKLTEEEIRKLSEEYGINYLVSESQGLEFPLAYANSRYYVYYVGS